MPPRSILPLLGVFLILRLVFWLTTFPNPDEAYYWLWGQHPEFSYYDHPPLAAWVQGAFTAVFGRSTFTLRLPNLISNGVFFYLYYRITHYLYGEKARQYFWLVVMLVLASPLYFLFLALAWHDHLMITLALASAYFFIRFLDGYLADGQGASWRLYAAGATIGLAGLCKYNAVFVFLGFAATVIFDKRLRPLLRDRRVYLAIAIAVSALLPILLWNMQNDFQSFRYYVNRSVNTGTFQLKVFQPIGFLLISILTLSPVNSFAIFRVVRRPKSAIAVQSTYKTVAIWIFAISTLTLIVISLVSAALYYWNITAYLLLLPLLPAAFVKGKPTEQQNFPPTAALSLKQRLFLGGQFYGLLFAVLLVVHYSLLPLSALVSKDADPDSRMLFGWRDVAAIVKTEVAQLRQSPFLVTTDYRSASALAYELHDRNVVAISDRVDQFDFWYKKDLLKGKDAVLLADDWHPFEQKLLAQFERTSGPITVPVTRFGVWIKNYYLMRGYSFKGQ